MDNSKNWYKKFLWYSKKTLVEMFYKSIIYWIFIYTLRFIAYIIFCALKWTCYWLSFWIVSDNRDIAIHFFKSYILFPLNWIKSYLCLTFWADSWGNISIMTWQYFVKILLLSRGLFIIIWKENFQDLYKRKTCKETS